MDIEDDTHMETQNVKGQITVNLPIVFSDEVVDVIVNQVLRRMDIDELIDDRIEYYMTHVFDINDYARDLDFYDIKSGIVDDVIEVIKERL